MAEPSAETRDAGLHRAERLERTRMAMVRWAVGSAPLVAVPVIVSVLVGAAWRGPSSLDPVLLVLLAFLAPLVLLARVRTRLHGGGWGLSVRASDRALTVFRPAGPRVELPWDDIAIAWIPRPGAVELITYGGDEVRLSGVDDADAVVAARQRLGPPRRPYVLALEHPRWAAGRALVAWVVAAVTVVAASSTPWAVFLTVAVLAGLLAWRASARRRVRFGADGLEAWGALGRRHRAFQRLRGARVEPRRAGLQADVVLEGAGEGPALRLYEIPHARAVLCAALVEEGVAMVGRGEAAGAHHPALERRDEDLGAWLARVGRAARGMGYRAAGIAPDQLVSLLRNPAAHPEQRAAAAQAQRAGEGGRARKAEGAEVSTAPGREEARSGEGVEEQKG
ncbi:MAG: hypothetical protein ACFCGT_23600, partial [Sandaracinaceae bacterium]